MEFREALTRNHHLTPKRFGTCLPGFSGPESTVTAMSHRAPRFFKDYTGLDRLPLEPRAAGAVQVEDTQPLDGPGELCVNGVDRGLGQAGRADRVAADEDRRTGR